MRDARRYLVRGRVQGVGFRFFTEAAAVRARVDGWVRNLADGRVEVYAEGEPSALENFERQIRRGPPGARVSDVEVTTVPPSDNRAGFDIR